MKLRKLKKENFIELCKLRLKHNKEEFTGVLIEDASFKHFNGVSFIIQSEKWADSRFTFIFDMFYPDEFMFLLELGVEF